MVNTKISWTDNSWNPFTGSHYKSEGCKHCYAKLWFKRMGNHPTHPWGKFETPNNYDWKRLNYPRHWKKSKLIFVCDLGHMFYEIIPLDWIQRVFKVMNECSWHTFQICTKRPERLLELSPELKFTENIWVGITVESDKYIDRIDLLRKVNCKTKFISIEPMLSPLPNLNLKDISLVIVGGESGSKEKVRNVMEKEWVLDIMRQCEKSNVIFHFKQWGSHNKYGDDSKFGGNLFDGKEYLELPEYTGSSRLTTSKVVSIEHQQSKNIKFKKEILIKKLKITTMKTNDARNEMIIAINNAVDNFVKSTEVEAFKKAKKEIINQLMVSSYASAKKSSDNIVTRDVSNNSVKSAAMKLIKENRFTSQEIADKLNIPRQAVAGWKAWIKRGIHK